MISSGSIKTGKDVEERLKHGANLVEIYSQLFLKGPYVFEDINKELLKIN